MEGKNGHLKLPGEFWEDLIGKHGFQKALLDEATSIRGIDGGNFSVTRT